MPFILTNSYVYDLYKDRGKQTKTAFITSLLSKPHLDIKSNIITISEKEQYSQITEICRKRLNYLIEKVQKQKWFRSDPTAGDQAFVNLEKYPDLISEYDSQPPSSLELFPSSQSSTKSEIEVLI